MLKINFFYWNDEVKKEKSKTFKTEKALKVWYNKMLEKYGEHTAFSGFMVCSGNPKAISIINNINDK